jgi:hypothetical protein
MRTQSSSLHTCTVTVFEQNVNTYSRSHSYIDAGVRFTER